MGKGMRRTAEQIIRKLRQADILASTHNQNREDSV